MAGRFISHFVRVFLLVSVAALGFAIPQLAVPDKVDAGHTAGPNGNCWRYADPLMCKTTYDCTASSPPSLDLNCPSQELRVRLVDYFSDARPAWWNAMHEAQRNWNAYYGPWDFQEFDRSDDTYVYLNDAVTGQNGLGSANFALVWNCSNTNFCTASSTTPMDIHWSNVFFNKNKMDSLGIGFSEWTNVFAHEIGHTLGLFHHSNTAALMYPGVQGNRQSPTSYELGSSTLCSNTSTYGLRCIYKFQ